MWTGEGGRKEGRDGKGRGRGRDTSAPAYRMRNEQRMRLAAAAAAGLSTIADAHQTNRPFGFSLWSLCSQNKRRKLEERERERGGASTIRSFTFILHYCSAAELSSGTKYVFPGREEDDVLRGLDGASWK